MKTHQYSSPSGFRFLYVDGFGDFLVVESENIKNAFNYIKKQKSINLYLNWRLGFSLQNLDFLAEVKELVKGLMIVANEFDYSKISTFNNLEYISFTDDTDQQVDFSRLKKIEYCSIRWNKNYNEKIFPESIREINLRGYVEGSGFNEASLANLRNVKKITLIESKIKNLYITKYCNSLSHITIAHCAYLFDIEHITLHSKSLLHLDIESCKKIADFSFLSRLTKLERLNLLNCKSIPSVAFVENLPALNHFVFLGTVVEDGKLFYLKRISHVAFNNKSHYDMKQVDFV